LCNNWRSQKEHVCFHRNICPNQYLLLSVGALLYIYAAKNGIEVPTGKQENQEPTFPEIAFHHLTLIPSVIFLLGLTAATFTSSALTALTTSFVSIFWVWIKPKTGTSPLQ
jgi:hypothetical protein